MLVRKELYIVCYTPLWIGVISACSLQQQLVFEGQIVLRLADCSNVLASTKSRDEAVQWLENVYL